MKIAFITIATNKYINFAKNLYSSIQQNCKFDLICLTNNPSTEYAIQLQLTHTPFPIISLLRYHYYYSYRNILKKYDYIYHIDCDMELKTNIEDEIIGDSVCVIHPSYYHSNISNNNYPYDRNPNSQAYIPYGLGKRYYQNCFQGGKTEYFLSMCDTLQKRIEYDLRNNYIALWHDESYMNRYMLENPPSIELPPTYAQPEDWPLLGETKILHKSKNHTEIRSI